MPEPHIANLIDVVAKLDLISFEVARHGRHDVISYGMQPNVLGLPAILAHEIGHTVGAYDEYGPKCRILHLCGFNHAPNANCEVGNQFATVDCLMKNNAQTLCFATQGHFGWGDQDLDGVLDPFDPDFISL